jgi:hypothetical protein
MLLGEEGPSPVHCPLGSTTGRGLSFCHIRQNEPAVQSPGNRRRTISSKTFGQGIISLESTLLDTITPSAVITSSKHHFIKTSLHQNITSSKHHFMGGFIS